MGMTLTTLSLYGAEASAVEPLLAPTDTLRTQNLPWLTIATSIENDPEPGARYRKLAKQLTKDTEATALLFFYFDDELFSCDLYQRGKKCASCVSNSSWSKLGKQLDALFGDDLASKAFRYAQRCCSLEEQVQLLEEALGAAVFDDTEDIPRVVARGDATLGAVKTRETLLRKRPNQYVLTEVPQAEWPENAKLREVLLKRLKAENKNIDVMSLLYSDFIKKYRVPGAESLTAYPMTESPMQWGVHVFRGTAAVLHYLFLYDCSTDEQRILGPFRDAPERVIWRRGDGGLVILFSNVIREHQDASSWSQMRGRGDVRCLSPDSTMLWQFTPEQEDYIHIEYIHTALDGLVTLFAGSINRYVATDAMIWQLDGETGTLVRHVRIPCSLGVTHLAYAASIGAFVYYERSTKSLVLLNDALEEIRRLPYSCSGYFKESQFCGELLWDCDDRRTVHLFDLRSGAEETVRLEIPAYPIAMLNDGRILAVPERFNALFVFDREGTLLSRCKLPAPGKLLVEGYPVSVPGIISEVIQGNDVVYVTEKRAPDSHGFLFDGYDEHISLHVWRLDPAAK